MPTKISKSVMLGLTLIGLQLCDRAQAQIYLQDGATNSVISDSDSSSISTSFTVTSGASVLVVSLYDRNDIASPSTPATLSWGSQTLTQAVAEDNGRSTYATVATYYLFNPTPGTHTITATDTNGVTPYAMAMQVFTLNDASTTNPPVAFSAYHVFATNVTATIPNVPSNAWAVVSSCLGYNDPRFTYLTASSGNPGYGQAAPSGDDVVMGAIAGMSAGMDTVSLGNATAGGVQFAMAGVVFTPAGVNTNFVTPQFSGLASSTTVTYGGTVALSGTVSTNGHYLPQGTPVTVSVDGDAQPTIINDSTGDFSIDYNTVDIPASSTPYTVTYASSAITFYLAATNTSTTMTINPLSVVVDGYKVYDGTTTVPASNLAVANLIGSDNLTLSGSVTVAGTDGGSETITSFGGLTLGGTAAADYTLTGASGSVTMITGGGIQRPGLTNWIGIFRNSSDIANWGYAGGANATYTFVPGDAPPWGPSTGALEVNVPATQGGGVYSLFGVGLNGGNGTDLSKYTQLEYDIKVSTNENVWDYELAACSAWNSQIIYGPNLTTANGPQGPIYPTAAYNGWVHMVVPASDFGPNSNLTNVEYQIFEAGEANFPTTNAAIVLEIANVEWVSPPVITSPTITLNPSNVVRIADSRLFAINTGSYDQDFHTDDTVPEAQKAGWTTFRYPGGVVNDVWHWTNYVTNPAVNNTLSNFCQVVTNVGARVVITSPGATIGGNPGHVVTNLPTQAFIGVNYGTGTPEEAAALVAYLNVTNHMGFKYFEIGNEVYAYSSEVDSNYPGHDPWEYGVRAASYITQMKAVDPTIKVGVCVVPSEQTLPGTNVLHYATNLVTGQVVSGWTPVLLSTLRQEGVTPDFVVYHCYPEGDPQYDNDAVLLATANWQRDAAELRADINDFFGPAGSNIELTVTEANSEGSTPGKQSVSLVNGLYYADSLGQMLQTEFNCRAWYQLHDGHPGETDGNLSTNLYGWRQYGALGIMDWRNGLALTNRYPPYFASELLTHFIAGGDEVVSASSDLSLVSAYGALRTNGDRTLMLINKSPTNYFGANIVLTNWVPGTTATVYSYGMPQDNTAKNGSNACDISTNTCNVSTNFYYLLAPYSINVIVFNQAAEPPSLSVLPVSSPGQFVMELGGQPNVPYVLQSSTDLYNWTSVSTDTISGSVLDITNVVVPGTSHQFWRALSQP